MNTNEVLTPEASPETGARPPYASMAACSPPSELKANILLVDDRDDKLLAIEAVLAPLGQNLVKVSSGKEALRQILKQDFAVILLDVLMPEMDGFETAVLIRQRPRSERTPIIFTTAADGAAEHVSRGYFLGAVDYLITPIVPEVLRTKVSVFVELYKQTAEIRRLNSELEGKVTALTELNHELEQRTAELNNTFQELAAANRELEAFGYSVSHDLRAPLRHISSYIKLLEQGAGLSLDEKSQRQLRTIAEAAQRMGHLIDDLLVLSRIGRTTMAETNVGLGQLVDEARKELAQEMVGRAIEWRIGVLPRVRGDAALLRSAMVNLLANAIKYTRPRNPARIEVGSQERSGDWVCFVRDNGVGFDMQFANKLFGVFQRLHDRDQFEGTGIGLATVRRIVQRHEGKTWAEGTVEGGATFYFSIPKERVCEAALADYHEEDGEVNGEAGEKEAA